MPALTSPDIDAIHAAIMRDLSRAFEPCATLKVDLRAALVAADQWVSDNAASYNTALPVAARSTLTPAQKSRLLMAVLERRFLSGL